MGLIKAATESLSSTMTDQWKEYFYCDSLEGGVLIESASKRTKGNNKGNDNIITNGSAIAVADGQCMIIVDNGKVAELCAEPGVFIWDSSTEPSIFAGDSFGDRIKKTFAEVGKRFTFGGDVASTQKVYYINTKHISGNKYGTMNPVPFRVVDNNIGLDVDISVRCNGLYTVQITNPILFYQNVCGNVKDRFMYEQIAEQLKSEVLTALQPAFARISEMGIRYSALPAHAKELANAMNEELSSEWRDLRGIEIITFGVNSITASKEDEDMIKDLQKNAVFRNPNMAAAQLAGAQAEAMKSAAKNSAGAMTGFMGMGMATQAGGANIQNLFAMGQQSQVQEHPQVQTQQEQVQKQTQQSWTCSCGHTGNTGKFCMECGNPKPEKKDGWTCSCGTVNQGKFCMECGAKKPADAPLYRCDKCGWKPEDPTHPPKFCPECGDPFDDSDKVNN